MQTARSHRDSFSLSGMRSRALNGQAEHKRIQRGLVKISLCAMENSRTVSFDCNQPILVTLTRLWNFPVSLAYAVDYSLRNQVDNRTVFDAA